MKSEAKRKGLFASLGLTLLAVISLAVWFGPTASDNPASANHSVTVGIDTDTSGNTALALGTLQACRVINVGQIVDIDLYVQGLSDIASFESYIKYDRFKINITKPGDGSQNNNANFMLQQAQPSPPGNSFTNLSEHLPDTANPGEYRVGGYDSVVIPGVQDPYPGTNPAQHGNGVLLRLQIQGLAAGFSPIEITPHGTGNGLGINIKDSTGLINVGDGADSDVFVDNVINGSIVVGAGACTDADGDGVPDASDNCPSVANSNQANFDGDSMGDACDPDDDNDTFSDTVEIAAGSNPLNAASTPEVCDGTDNDLDGQTDEGFPDFDNDGVKDCVDPEDDGDGYSDIAESGAPLCANALNDDSLDDSLVNDGCPAVGAAETACTGSIDDDLDGFRNDGCPQSGVFSEGLLQIGTNALDNCGNPTTVAPIYSLSWPGDLLATGSSANKVNLADIATFVAPVRRLNQSPKDPNYHPRWDLVPGSVSGKLINLQDISSLVTVYPSMFGGSVRAFNGPACTP